MNETEQDTLKQPSPLEVIEDFTAGGVTEQTEIDYPVSVKVPKKIGRRIKMIAEGMKGDNDQRQASNPAM